MSRYFIDTEFAETGDISDTPTIDLISIAIVCDDGREYYAESLEYDVENCNKWVEDNVLPRLGKGDAKERSVIALDIINFVGSDPAPEFWGYYADYDWVALCWLYGCMVDLPTHFPMFCMDLQQWWVQLGSLNIKPPQPEDEHHALADARWNHQLWKVLEAQQQLVASWRQC